MHPAERGFIKWRYTCTNLLESFSDWTLHVQSQQQVAIVYIEFSKTFDVISQRKLFARLQPYGICGNVLLCCRSVSRKPCCRKETARCRSCSFGLKFAENIHCKFRSSQARLQSSKHTGAKQNLTKNGHSRSFKVTCFGVSGKALLQFSSPQYLHNIIATQPPRSTRSSSLVSVLHPPVQSRLKVNCSFRCAAPLLWNKLSHSLRIPHQSDPTHSSSLSSSPDPRSAVNLSHGLSFSAENSPFL